MRWRGHVMRRPIHLKLQQHRLGHGTSITGQVQHAQGHGLLEAVRSPPTRRTRPAVRSTDFTRCQTVTELPLLHAFPVLGSVVQRDAPRAVPLSIFPLGSRSGTAPRRALASPDDATPPPPRHRVASRAFPFVAHVLRLHPCASRSRLDSNKTTARWFRTPRPR